MILTAIHAPSLQPAPPRPKDYNVAIHDSKEAHCGCKFFSENSKFGVCKHTTRVNWLLTEAQDQAERDAEEDRIADDAGARMEALIGLEGDALTRAFGRA